ncbi:unnamed protein product, partial [Brassica oleracea var. botrytis]
SERPSNSPHLAAVALLRLGQARGGGSVCAPACSTGLALCNSVEAGLQIEKLDSSSAMVVASVSATNLTVTKLSQQPLMNLELRSDLQPIPRLRRRNTSSESSSSSIHSSPSSIVVDIFRS